MCYPFRNVFFLTFCADYLPDSVRNLNEQVAAFNVTKPLSIGKLTSIFINHITMYRTTSIEIISTFNGSKLRFDFVTSLLLLLFTSFKQMEQNRVEGTKRQIGQWLESDWTNNFLFFLFLFYSMVSSNYNIISDQRGSFIGVNGICVASIRSQIEFK